MAFTGGCLCGNLKYSIENEPITAALCYCTSCRRSTSSICTSSLVVNIEGFKSSGEPTIFTRKGDSGQDVHNHFCGGCGTTCWVTSTGLESGGVMLIRSGTLDHLALNEKHKPTAELYCRDKYKWLPDVPGTQQFNTSM